MNAIEFHVFPPRTHISAANAPTFVLRQDNWNDYSFQTLYHLSHFSDKDGVREETVIGPVKILRKGQTKSDGLLISSNFEQLGLEFCSVGGSLDYYERLQELGELGGRILRALRDVVQSPVLVDEFRGEEGWRTSLFRDQTDAGENFRHMASGVADGHYAAVAEDQQAFSFHMPGWLNPVDIDTTSGESNPWLGATLPERVNVVVGRNGSGKSTLLSRLARVAFASVTQRVAPAMSALGKMEPAGVGFPRIITVAFSPFDSFRLPGSGERDVAQVAKDSERGVGRFAFIGLRDFAAEASASIADLPVRDLGDVAVEADRVGETRLKSIAQLCEDFDRYRQRISDDQQRQLVLAQALLKLKSGLLSEEWGDALTGLQDEAARAWFHQCSTGHKIALLVVFGLVASLQKRSLVLIDEPEAHLHPPLLSAMMHALRHVLKKFESTALVATHSPVVVQECLAKHVHVIRREGETFAVRPLLAETFGESIGLITSQVFSMESDALDYHRVLDKLVDEKKSMAAIEAQFLDGVMSNQARAYVLSRLAEGDTQ
ncbi:AAA family ATPase [Roseateles sp. DB2]|uniref:AAA family ATPase n=1 Tax=Roseateles sp. DB2 TaxID=3453717 RepID=UPI003EEB9922